MSRISKKFTNSDSRTIIQGWHHNNVKGEDNFIYVSDIDDFVSKNHNDNVHVAAIDKLAKINYKKPSGHVKISSGAIEEKKSSRAHHGNSFIGVFDGHDGKNASIIASSIAVYELFALPEYHEQKYEEALKKLFINIHESILNINPKLYFIEEGQPYSSGTTASVVLITPRVTYFASIGNSPIIISLADGPERGAVHAGACHNNLNDKCLQRVSESGIPILKPRSETKGASSLIIGDELSVFGGVGSPLYEPDIFNRMIRHMKKFKREKESKISRYIESKCLAQKFGDYLRTKDSSLLQFLNFPSSAPKVNTTFYENLLKSNINELELKTSPITKKPYINGIKNELLFGFLIASDGVIEPKMPGSSEPLLQSLIFDKDMGFDKCFKECSSLTLPSTSNEDDRTGFLCWFNHKKSHSRKA